MERPNLRSERKRLRSVSHCDPDSARGALGRSAIVLCLPLVRRHRGSNAPPPLASVRARQRRFGLLGPPASGGSWADLLSARAGAELLVLSGSLTAAPSRLGWAITSRLAASGGGQLSGGIRPLCSGSDRFGRLTANTHRVHCSALGTYRERGDWNDVQVTAQQAPREQ